MPQEPLPPKKLTVPEFAARIKAKHPQYKDLVDDDLTNRVLEKYPSYSGQVDVGTLTRGRTAKDTAQAYAEEGFAQAGARMAAAGERYRAARPSEGMSPTGQLLNPPVDTSPSTYNRPLTPAEKAAQQRGEPVIISQAQQPTPAPQQPVPGITPLLKPRVAPQVAPPTYPQSGQPGTGRVAGPTPPPVNLAPVLENRVNQIREETKRRETQQKVEQARQVMQGARPQQPPELESDVLTTNVSAPRVDAKRGMPKPVDPNAPIAIGHAVPVRIEPNDTAESVELKALQSVFKSKGLTPERAAGMAKWYQSKRIQMGEPFDLGQVKAGGERALVRFESPELVALANQQIANQKSEQAYKPQDPGPVANLTELAEQLTPDVIDQNAKKAIAGLTGYEVTSERLAQAYNSVQGGIQDMAISTLQSVPLIAASADGLDIPADKMPLYVLLESVRDQGRKLYPNNPRLQNEYIATKIPQGIGSALGFMAIGAATGPLGAAAGGTALGTVGALGQLTSMYQEAKAKGATEAQAREAMWWGIPIGATEVIGIGSIARRLNALTGGTLKGITAEGIKAALKRAGVDILKETGEEAIQNTGQGVASAAVAREIYDKNRNIFGTVKEDLIVGVVSAFLMSGAGSAPNVLMGAAKSAQAPQTLIDYALQSPLTTAEDRTKINKLVDLDEATPEAIQAVLSGESEQGEVPAVVQPKSAEQPAIIAQPTAVPVPTQKVSAAPALEEAEPQVPEAAQPEDVGAGIRNEGPAVPAPEPATWQAEKPTESTQPSVPTTPKGSLEEIGEGVSQPPKVLKLGGGFADPNAPNRQAQRRIMEMGEANPLNPRESIIDGVKYSLKTQTMKPNELYLDIESAERGQGNASRVLDQLLAAAKEDGIDIVGLPKAFGRGGLSTKQLKEWYARHGFEPYRGDLIIKRAESEARPKAEPVVPEVAKPTPEIAPTTPEVTTPTTEKQPWEMTRDEWNLMGEGVEPPVPEGMQRLYRGETIGQRTAKWFGSDEAAFHFAAERELSGKKARITYVDVPPEIAEKYVDADAPQGEAAVKLPPEIAAQRKTLRNRGTYEAELRQARKPAKPTESVERPTTPTAGAVAPVAGQRIAVTGVGDKGAFELEVKGEKDGKIEIGYPDSKIVATRIPKESFKQYVDDLAGRVDVPANSGRPEIDAVASGKAEYLGKGDDGLVFRVGDSVVKVSTVVPYIPTNPGVRTPAQAVENLRRQYKITEEARKAGVPGILYSEFVEHGDKGFEIRPFVEIPDSMTNQQLAELRDIIEQMNEKGFTNHDQLQAGIRNGQVYLFDTGKLARLSEKQSQREDDIEDDSRHFQNFAERMGQKNPLPTKQQARKQFDRWREGGGLLLGKESRDYGDLRRRALIASGEDADVVNKQFEEGLAKHEAERTKREEKKAAKQQAPEKAEPIDWTARLRTAAASKDINALQALADEMGTHKNDPKVARLRGLILAELAGIRQPKMAEQAPEAKPAARTPEEIAAREKLSKKAKKLLTEAESKEGKTVRPKPKHVIGRPKLNSSLNRLEVQVRAHGGLKDDFDEAYSGELKALSEAGKRGIVNQTSGIGIERAATMLAEEGYGRNIWWEGQDVGNVDPHAFIQAVIDDADGTRPQHSEFYDQMEEDPDVKAWDSMIESEAVQEILKKVEAGNATAKDIAALTREAEGSGVSERALDAWLDAIHQTLEGQLREQPEMEEGYRLDEDGTLLDPDGQPLFALEGPAPEYIPPYTLTVLNDEKLANKSGKEVKFVTIKQILKQSTTKQIEREIIAEVLELPGFKGKESFSFDDFEAAVQESLLPLRVIESTSYSDYGGDNVGVPTTKNATTNIYNTDLEHGVTGHFQDVFTKDWKGAPPEYEIREVVNPRNDRPVYIAVPKNVELNEANIGGMIGTATGSREKAEEWLKTFTGRTAENAGMFGWTRVWQAPNGQSYIAEIQSDAFQKYKAEQLILDHYLNLYDSGELKAGDPLYSKIDDLEAVKHNVESVLPSVTSDYQTLHGRLAETNAAIQRQKDLIAGLKALDEAGLIDKFNDSVNEVIAQRGGSVSPHQFQNVASVAFSRLPAEARIQMQTALPSQPTQRLAGGTVYHSTVDTLGTILSVAKHPKSSLGGEPTRPEGTMKQGVDRHIEQLEGSIVHHQSNADEIKSKLDHEKYRKYEADLKLQRQIEKQILQAIPIRDKQFIAHRKNYTTRLMREEIRRQASMGQKSVLIPTPRTLALIEGYISAGETMPYEIVGRDTDRLSVSDKVKIGDVEYTVVKVDGSDIEVAKSEQVFVIDEYEEAEYQAKEAIKEAKDALAQYEGETLNIEDADEIKEAIESAHIYGFSYDESDIEYYFDPDEDGNYKFDFASLEDKLEASAWETASQDTSDSFDGYDKEYTTFLSQGRYQVVEDGASTESFQQPDVYSDRKTEIAEFDPADFSDTERTVLEKYQELNELFLKERPDAKTIADDSGAEWLESQLTENDAGPVPLFSRAFHGSPYEFDKFSTEKIGTGEGAQAYGYGLYFTDKKEIADYYRKSLVGRGAEPRDIAHRIYDALPEDWPHARKNEAVIKELERRKSDSKDILFHRAMDQAIEAVHTGQHTGRTYEVELAPKEDEYLLWDKPLNEQSEKVQKALKKSDVSIGGKGINEWPSGEEIYRSTVKLVEKGISLERAQKLALSFNKATQEASEYLHSLGIRGIKYLDQGSRTGGADKYEVRWSEDGKSVEVFLRPVLGAPVKTFDTFAEADKWVEAHQAAPTYNYVIFSDEDVEIINQPQFAHQLGFTEEGLTMQEATPAKSTEKEELKAREQQRLEDANPERTAAIKKLEELKRRGLTVDEYARQGSMFEAAPTADEIKLLKQLERPSKAKPTDQQGGLFAGGWTVADAGSTEVVVSVEGNQVAMNAPAAAVLTQMYQDVGFLSRTSKGVRGSYERLGPAMARNLRKMASQGVKGADKLADAVEQAVKNGNGKVVLFYGENAKKHELFHEASDKANRILADRHGDAQSLTSDKAWVKIHDWLVSQGYPNQFPTLIEEGAAHIAEGQYERMGLTREEAIDWMEKWFKSFEMKNPNVTPATFKEMSDEAEQARERVYQTQSAALGQPGKDVSRLEEGRARGDRANLARAPDVIGSKGFKQWQGEAKLIRAGESLRDVKTGQPVVIEGFHGTTHDYSVIDTEEGFIENDFGKGFYVSNTAEDVAENYAGIGPDLTSRIERLSDQLSDDGEIEAEFDEKIASGELPYHSSLPDYVREVARQRLTEHEGMTMKVFVKMNNPLVLGGTGETYWDMEQPMDEEGEFLDEEPTGKLIDFADALRQASAKYDDGEIEDAIQAVLGDYDGIKPSEAIARLHKTESFGWFTDEDGNLANNEIIREAIERMGYDGIVDNTVDVKFGSQRRAGKKMAGMGRDTSHVIVWDSKQVKSATGNQGTFDPNNPNILLAREANDPWARLSELAELEAAREKFRASVAKGQKPRSLPPHLEAAGLEAGPEKGYEPESIIDDGLVRAQQIIADKGIDGAMEFVRSGDGIEWASVGYEVSGRLRAQERQLRAEGKTDEADALNKKRMDFLDEFSLGAVERGRSIVGIKAISEFAPDRMAYMLNKASLKKRKHGISPETEARIALLGEQLGELEQRNSFLQKALDEAVARAKKRIGGKGKGKAKSDYQSRLDEQAQVLLQTLKPKVGKFDFTGLAKESQKGAVTPFGAPLPGDAELLAQYAASQLSKLDTVADLNSHLLSEFGDEITPHLSKIRQRAYSIRAEARQAEIESEETEPKRRRTILEEIQKEIGAEVSAIRAAQKAQDQAKKAERKAQVKEARAEARKAAKQARELEHEARKEEIKQARVELKRLRKELADARKAEDKGYRETKRAQREAERKAQLWDTPLRNAAAEARERLQNATDASDSQVMEDLVAVATEKFLPAQEGGQPRKGAVDPARVYKDLKDEFPKLVTKKNQAKIYKLGYQRILDATAAARVAARMRSASAESKRLWDELGVDTDAQSVLIQQAEVKRQQDDLRGKAAAEFNRVNKTFLEKAWLELNAIPRSLQSSIDAPLGRQGVFFLLTHPIRASRSAIPATLKGYGAIHVADYAQLERELVEAPGYDLALQSGVDMSAPSGRGDPALIAEEQFQSPLAARIFPHVRLSEQGYVMGMNAERLAMFNRFADMGREDGYTPEENPEFFEAAAKFVNVATGRGDIGNTLKRAAALLNFFFFSTRLNISRIQLLNDLFNPVKYLPEKANVFRAVPGAGSYDPVMRKIMAQEVLRLAVHLGAIYSIAAALGIGIEFDPDDPDALLLRVRNTRYDITGGEVGTLRFLYRFSKALYLNADSNNKLDDHEKPLAIAGKFLRYKLAPLPSGVLDAVTGKDAVGQPANLRKFTSPKQVVQENVIIKRALPILTSTFVDAVSEEGLIGVPMALPALAGFGVSSYPDRGIRAIKNQAVVDAFERLKINSQSLMGQSTKNETLDQEIQKRILKRVETLDIAKDATDTGQEKLIREQLEQYRTIARSEALLAKPDAYTKYLTDKESSETLSFLPDAEKAQLTEADLRAFRARYAKIYVDMVQKRLTNAGNFANAPWEKLSDDQKAKWLTGAARMASTMARFQTMQTRKPLATTAPAP